ncbi:MAG: hypothetical protein ACQER9_03435, partial [Nanobdellota archaeon]
PQNDKQEGVCSGSTKTCDGSNGWINDYTSISDYESTETACDGKDNDCDGKIDNNLNPPQNDNQKGVCSGSTKTCDGSNGWINDYTSISDYESTETACDALDNDCDNSIDENNVCCGNSIIDTNSEWPINRRAYDSSKWPKRDNQGNYNKDSNDETCDLGQGNFLDSNCNKNSCTCNDGYIPDGIGGCYEELDCPPGFINLLRYDFKNTLTNSEVTDDMTDYTYKYPLCVKSNNLEKNKGITVTKISNNKISDSGTEIKATFDACEIKQDCGDATKIASLNQENNAYLSSPNLNSPYSLCCYQGEKGIKFENDNNQIKFTCSETKDGICPEDYENSTGNKISCLPIKDPDCGYSTSDHIKEVVSTFDKETYITGMENSDDAIVAIADEENKNAEKTYTFRINSEKNIQHSITEISFSYSEGTPDIFFDNNPVSVCPPNPSPTCYEWNQDERLLTLHHPLSEHQLKVKFTYSQFAWWVFLLLVFAIIIPIFIAYNKRFKDGLLINIKQDTEEYTHNLERIFNYVEEKLKEGMNEDEIKLSLKKVGWKNHIIELAMKGAHKKGNDKSKLEQYIKSTLDQNLSRSEIYSTLMSAGWDKKDIDEVFKKVGGKVK